MRDGKTEETGRIKSNLPAILMSGQCEGGHTKASFRIFSALQLMDIDHYAGDFRALLDLLSQKPWVYAGWITVSGEGIKVVVRVDVRLPMSSRSWPIHK